MDKNVGKIVLSSLRFALLGEAMPPDAAQFCTPSDLRRAAQFCQKQDVLHLLAFALKENAIPLGEEARSVLEKSMMKAVYQTERIEHERSSLCALLEEEGIDHVPLKGARIRHLYPETWMRTSSDADILVPKEEIERASALVTEKRNYRFLERGSHDVAFLSPCGAHMELHFSLVEKDRLPRAARICEKAWSFSVPVEGKKHEKALTSEFFYFYHLAHMAKHLNNGGVGIRFFLDLFLIREKTEMDEKRLSDLLSEGGLAEFEKASHCLARHLILGEEISPEAAELMEFVFANSIFGRRESYVAIRRGRKGKFRYLWERLFAPYDTLCGMYPSLEGKRHLVFLYQWKRIFDHLRAGRLSASKEEFRRNLLMSEKEAEKTAHLLRSLHLDFYD